MRWHLTIGFRLGRAPSDRNTTPGATLERYRARLLQRGTSNMTSRRFLVRTLSACSLDGRRLVAGAQIELEALAAADLIRAGKGLLVRSHDLESLAAAAAAQSRHAGQLRTNGAGITPA